MLWFSNRNTCCLEHACISFLLFLHHKKRNNIQHYVFEEKKNKFNSKQLTLLWIDRQHRKHNHVRTVIPNSGWHHLCGHKRLYNNCHLGVLLQGHDIQMVDAVNDDYENGIGSQNEPYTHYCWKENDLPSFDKRNNIVQGLAWDMFSNRVIGCKWVWRVLRPSCRRHKQPHVPVGTGT